MIGLSLWQKGTELLEDGLDEARLECGHGMYAPLHREASDTPRMIEHLVPVYMLTRSLLAEPLSVQRFGTTQWIPVRSILKVSLRLSFHIRPRADPQPSARAHALPGARRTAPVERPAPPARSRAALPRPRRARAQQRPRRSPSR